jgi:hypothetical protein
MHGEISISCLLLIKRQRLNYHVVIACYVVSVGDLGISESFYLFIHFFLGAGSDIN